MFTHLLVPLDGSRLAESALPVVVEFARRLSAQVTIFHAVERDAPTTVHGDRHLTMPSEAQAYLAGVSSWLGERGISAAIELSTDGGDVATRIAASASAVGAGLVVLSTHGWSGVRGLLFGRVAQQVLQRCSIPVLLVQPTPAGREQAFTCRRLMVPLDGSATAEVVLQPAAAVSYAFGAELLLVMVVPTVETIAGERAAATRLMPTAAAALLESETEEGQRYLEAVASRLGSADGRPSAIVGRGEAVRVLLDTAARREADLIIMATHGRSGVSAVWAGSVAARLIAHSTRPVLLVRIPRVEQ